MLIIQASNIHTGGGATLLNSLLRGCDALKLEVLVIHDERFRSENFGSHIKMQRVPANLIARLITEWKIFKQAKTDDTTLFFGNLPPLFPVKGNCILLNLPQVEMSSV